MLALPHLEARHSRFFYRLDSLFTDKARYRRADTITRCLARVRFQTATQRWPQRYC